MTVKHKWWQEAIGYQIYPKSFQDSNHDGIGDIQGIIQHLDQLKDLGITVIWISPINLSPMVDHGYDISDYLQIDPSFGTNGDFEELIAAANDRGIKVLLDLVINHTSSEHEWFKKAMEDLNSEYADYYVIKEGKGDLPPNNWRSIFGGSAWEKIAGTNKYYLHLFTVEQPDVNWENPKLRQELYKVIEFWLDKGVAGFRIDAISHIKKIYDQEDSPADGPDGLATNWELYRDAEGIGEFLGEMRDMTFKGKDILTIAEMDVEDPQKWEEYFGDDGYFTSIFDFYHTPFTVQDKKYRDDPVAFIEMLKKLVFKKQQLANGRVFFTNFIENHDLPRALNRFIPQKEINFHSASALALFYFFLRGIPVIYQGQEIGMVDYPKASIEEYVDLATHNNYQDYLLRNYTEVEALQQINIENRENSRTPMQWDNTAYAGFSDVTPWFAVNPNYPQLNYQVEEENPASLLNFYKKMTTLRKRAALQPIWIDGDSLPILEDYAGCIAYQRVLVNQKLTVVINFTNKKMTLPLEKSEVLLTNYDQVAWRKKQVELQPYQGLILKD
ncbi:alpha-glucosidase [Enterococcus sp. HY326]|uniref:alpha-glucosidase n=1 Tax=Enterococcus sp. HY326 TaxID=2971265 RepID=UPI00223EFF99|nr:alpha-glucosidase [Enterococcus sp. HY326]